MCSSVDGSCLGFILVLWSDPKKNVDCFSYSILILVATTPTDNTKVTIPWYSISCCKIIIIYLVLEPDTSHREEGSGHAPTFILSPWNAITRRMYLGTSNQWRYLITLVAPLNMLVVWHSTTSCHIQLEMNNETFSMMSFPFNEFDWSHQPLVWGKLICGCVLAVQLVELVWFAIVNCFHHLAPQSFPVLIRCFDTVIEFCCKVLL